MRELGRGPKTQTGPVPAAKTETLALVIMKTQGALISVFPALPGRPTVRSGPGPELLGQSKPQDLERPPSEKRVALESPRLGLLSPCYILKFPNDWCS